MYTNRPSIRGLLSYRASNWTVAVAHIQADKAERESDFELVAKIRYGEIKEKARFMEMTTMGMNESRAHGV